MKKLFRIFICLLAALHLAGGHLGMMQLIAWGQMLHDYSQTKGLITGVLETFDGEHPCAKCCKIAQAEKEEQKKDPLELIKLEKLSKLFSSQPALELPSLVWNSELRLVSFSEPVISAAERSIAPPVPPPRVFA